MMNIKPWGEVISWFNSLVCMSHLPGPQTGEVIQIQDMLVMTYQVWSPVIMAYTLLPLFSYGIKETKVKFSTCRKNRSRVAPVSWEWRLWPNSWLRVWDDLWVWIAPLFWFTVVWYHYIPAVCHVILFIVCTHRPLRSRLLTSENLYSCFVHEKYCFASFTRVVFKN